MNLEDHIVRIAEKTCTSAVLCESDIGGPNMANVDEKVRVLLVELILFQLTNNETD